MEKKKPHYDLKRIFEFIDNEQYAITYVARINAAKCFNYDPQDIIAEVKKLTLYEFVKSMTSHLNHTIWQDVYNLELLNGEIAYVKIQIVQEQTVIIQFKRK